MKHLMSINGEITSLENAVIPATDRGFLFGDNIFETIVAFSGKILNLDRHLERLRRSADNLQMSIPWSDEELKFELMTLCEQNPQTKSFLRLVVTRGCGFGLAFEKETVPNKYIYCLPAKVENSSFFANGIALKKKKSHSIERGPAAKTGNYLSSIVAISKSTKEGYDDVLWINRDSEVTESSTSNIFFIGRYGDEVEIVTPSLYSGLLKGITRTTVIELLTRAKIRVEERVIYEEEIPKFDEAFVCSTVRGLVPVRKISEHVLHTTRDSSVYQHIHRLYMTWAEVELGYRVDWNTGKKVTES